MVSSHRLRQPTTRRLRAEGSRTSRDHDDSRREEFYSERQAEDFARSLRKVGLRPLVAETRDGYVVMYRPSSQPSTQRLRRPTREHLRARSSRDQLELFPERGYVVILPGGVPYHNYETNEPRVWRSRSAAKKVADRSFGRVHPVAHHRGPGHAESIWGRGEYLPRKSSYVIGSRPRRRKSSRDVWSHVKRHASRASAYVKKKYTEHKNPEGFYVLNFEHPKGTRPGDQNLKGHRGPFKTREEADSIARTEEDAWYPRVVRLSKAQMAELWSASGYDAEKILSRMKKSRKQKSSRDPLTTQARNRLSTSKFALPARRALPIEDASHVRNAAARLEQMRIRGSVTGREYASALRKIRAAERKLGIRSSSARAARTEQHPRVRGVVR